MSRHFRAVKIFRNAITKIDHFIFSIKKVKDPFEKLLSFIRNNFNETLAAIYEDFLVAPFPRKTSLKNDSTQLFRFNKARAD